MVPTVSLELRSDTRATVQSAANLGSEDRHSPDVKVILKPSSLIKVIVRAASCES